MLSTLIRGFAGATDGRFYRVSPSFVDSALPPGASVIPRPTFAAWLRAGPLVLVNTPNTIWALIAVCMFECVPYDLSRTGPAASAPLSAAFFAARLPLWLGVWLGYTLWWHATLHWFGFAERPFVAAREYRPGRVAHNLVWSVSGVVIWTGFENVFAYLWATGRLAYVDETAWSSRRGALHFCAALLLVPLWRDVHFFFAHRMLHFNALYAQVHSLHHRNTDVEPFSGLCMHPVEHLYYFACALPSLLLLTTPFALLWNGVHLLLSPGASHSGFEDHWQADAYHYFHHRYVSCNYAGTNAGFLDVWFGSFVDTLKPTDQKGCKPRPDAKATLTRPPSLEFAAYLALSAGCVLAWAVAASDVAAGAHAAAPRFAAHLAVLAGFGPVAAASAVTGITRSGGGAPRGGPLKTGLLLAFSACR